MQLDRTEVVIRTRTLSELGDLGLRLLHRFPGKLVPVAIAGSLPTMLIAFLAVGHLLPDLGWPQLLEEPWDSIAQDDFNAVVGRWVYWIVLLSITMAPWSGLPLTHLLGQIVFERSPSRREAIAALGQRPWATFWVLGLVRLSVFVVLLAASTWFVPPDVYFAEVLGGIAALLMLTIRGSRPFVVEMLLLERCPLRAGAGGLPLRVRSSALHSPLAGELGGRSLTTGAMAAVLGGSLFYTLVWSRGVLLGQWSYDAIAMTVFLPVSLWTVLSLCTIVRFLGYLDARIRLEGWEVELAMRAEAIRQFGEAADALSPPPVTDRPPETASKTKTAAAAAAALMLSLAVGPPAGADEPIPPAAEVLSSSKWFDAAAGQLRPLTLPREPGEEINRRSVWTAKPPKPSTPWNWNFDLSNVLSWVMLICLVVAVTGGIIFAMQNAEWFGSPAAAGSASAGAGPMIIDPARIEDLPEEIRHLSGNPREMALELANRGRYDEAIVRLFGHQLLLLDAAGLVRLRREHTNGMYCRQCRSRDAAIGGQLRQTADAFERSYFGHHRVDAATWAGLWAGNEELERRAEAWASGQSPAGPAKTLAPAPAVLPVAILVLVAGCGSGLEMPYGGTRGMTASGSLNGLTGLRTIVTTPPAAAQDVSLRVRDLRVLSGRSLDCDAILWAPTDWPPRNLTEVTGWLDNWLAIGDRRLVVVLPDAGSELAYWRQTAPMSPDIQKPRHRRRIAQSLSADLVDRLGKTRLSHPTYYQADRLPPDDRSAQPSPSWRVEAAFDASAADDPAADEPAADEPAADEPAEPTGGKVIGQPPGPPPSLVRLGDPGQPNARWANSEVWVVPGGSLVTNFAMVRPAGRRLAVQIRDIAWQSFSPAEPSLEIGFLPSDAETLPVSHRTASTPPATGLEFMTTWPISLVTLHGLFLGVVICLALLPIFGRPRPAAASPTGRFATHLDAMARLLSRNASVDVAAGRISRYLRQVRGETTGPGVLDAPPPDRPLR